MAIQFSCTSCEQPIEVDDEYAGQTAACPYCRHLVTVPEQSTYQPRDAISARPAGPPDSYPADEASPQDRPPDQGSVPPVPLPYHRTEFTQRQQAARTFGNFALVCAAITIALFLVVFGYSMILGARMAAGTMPGPASFEKMAEELQQRPEMPWLQGGQCGMLFFALIGLVLAIVSLTQSRVANWRGWTAAVVCGGLLLGFCALLALMLIFMASGTVPLG